MCERGASAAYCAEARRALTFADGFADTGEARNPCKRRSGPANKQGRSAFAGTLKNAAASQWVYSLFR